MIYIFGPPRSGTSMTAGLLSLAGVQFGLSEEEVSPTPICPKGGWEHSEVVRINEDLLTMGGCNVHELIPVDEYRKVREAMDHEHPDCVRVQRERIQSFLSTGVQAIKDPRFCVTLGMWASVDPGWKDARVIYCSRSLEDVSRSMQRRMRFEQSRSGIEQDYPLSESRELSLLYLQHSWVNLLQAPSFFVLTTDDLFSDSRERMGKALFRYCGLDPDLGDSMREVVDAWIEKCYWHPHEGLP
jgi:hypothetical protein